MYRFIKEKQIKKKILYDWKRTLTLGEINFYGNISIYDSIEINERISGNFLKSNNFKKIPLYEKKALDRLHKSFPFGKSICDAAINAIDEKRNTPLTSIPLTTRLLSSRVFSRSQNPCIYYGPQSKLPGTVLLLHCLGKTTIKCENNKIISTENIPHSEKEFAEFEKEYSLATYSVIIPAHSVRKPSLNPVFFPLKKKEKKGDFNDTYMILPSYADLQFDKIYATTYKNTPKILNVKSLKNSNFELDKTYNVPLSAIIFYHFHFTSILKKKIKNFNRTKLDNFSLLAFYGNSEFTRFFSTNDFSYNHQNAVKKTDQNTKVMSRQNAALSSCDFFFKHILENHQKFMVDYPIMQVFHKYIISKSTNSTQAQILHFGKSLNERITLLQLYCEHMKGQKTSNFKKIGLLETKLKKYKSHILSCSPFECSQILDVSELYSSIANIDQTKKLQLLLSESGILKSTVLNLCLMSSDNDSELVFNLTTGQRLIFNPLQKQLLVNSKHPNNSKIFCSKTNFFSDENMLKHIDAELKSASRNQLHLFFSKTIEECVDDGKADEAILISETLMSLQGAMGCNFLTIPNLITYARAVGNFKNEWWKISDILLLASQVIKLKADGALKSVYFNNISNSAKIIENFLAANENELKDFSTLFIVLLNTLITSLRWKESLILLSHTGLKIFETKKVGSNVENKSGILSLLRLLLIIPPEIMRSKLCFQDIWKKKGKVFPFFSCTSNSIEKTHSDAYQWEAALLALIQYLNALIQTIDFQKKSSIYFLIKTIELLYSKANELVIDIDDIDIPYLALDFCARFGLADTALFILRNYCYHWNKLPIYKASFSTALQSTKFEWTSEQALMMFFELAVRKALRNSLPLPSEDLHHKFSTLNPSFVDYLNEAISLITFKSHNRSKTRKKQIKNTIRCILHAARFIANVVVEHGYADHGIALLNELEKKTEKLKMENDIYSKYFFNLASSAGSYIADLRQFLCELMLPRSVFLSISECGLVQQHIAPWTHTIASSEGVLMLASMEESLQTYNSKALWNKHWSVYTGDITQILANSPDLHYMTALKTNKSQNCVFMRGIRPSRESFQTAVPAVAQLAAEMATLGALVLTSTEPVDSVSIGNKGDGLAASKALVRQPYLPTVCSVRAMDFQFRPALFYESGISIRTKRSKDKEVNYVYDHLPDHHRGGIYGFTVDIKKQMRKRLSVEKLCAVTSNSTDAKLYDAYFQTSFDQQNFLPKHIQNVLSLTLKAVRALRRSRTIQISLRNILLSEVFFSLKNDAEAGKIERILDSAVPLLVQPTLANGLLSVKSLFELRESADKSKITNSKDTGVRWPDVKSPPLKFVVLRKPSGVESATIVRLYNAAANEVRYPLLTFAGDSQAPSRHSSATPVIDTNVSSLYFQGNLISVRPLALLPRHASGLLVCVPVQYGRSYGTASKLKIQMRIRLRDPISNKLSDPARDALAKKLLEANRSGDQASIASVSAELNIHEADLLEQLLREESRDLISKYKLEIHRDDNIVNSKAVVVPSLDIRAVVELASGTNSGRTALEDLERAFALHGWRVVGSGFDDEIDGIGNPSSIEYNYYSTQLIPYKQMKKDMLDRLGAQREIDETILDSCLEKTHAGMSVFRVEIHTDCCRREIEVSQKGEIIHRITKREEQITVVDLQQFTKVV